MSDFFDASGNRISDGLTARAADVNTLRDEVGAGFDLLPDVANLNAGTVSYAVDTGTANSYLVSLPQTPASYTDGLLVTMRPINSNTGASTINVNGLGVKEIRGIDNLAVGAGDIVSGVPIDLRYSTATGYFHLAPNSSVDATAAAASAAAAAASASAASTSASNASASASAASSSATSAATSASAAATSASSASTSATNAASSATNAASSLSDALAIYGSISAVNTAATNAATSATNASNSATAAATSATNAGNSATAAAASSASASTYATTATTQAANAAASAAGATALYGSLGAVQAAEASATASATSASASATTATNQAAAAAASALSAASVVSQDLSAIDRTVFAATIVDAFLYDTEKDSDGGAWRKRCAHTSWENETLSGNWLGSAANETAARAISGATTGSFYYDTTALWFYTLNAGSGKTATYRGNVRQFPAKVLITVEAARVVLWDLTQAGVPMWMVFSFPTYSTGANFTNTPYGLCGNTSYGAPGLTAISMLNGRGFIAANDGGTDCGWDFDLVTEQSFWHCMYPTNGTLTLRQKLLGNISQRNSTTTAATGDKYGATSTNGIRGASNDVAMTVLPNAPVDVATGLPIPTIAVATAGGVSVIKDDGNVWDITAVEGGAYSVATCVEFSRDRLRFVMDSAGNYRSFLYSTIPTADKTVVIDSSSVTDKYLVNSTATASVPKILGGSSLKTDPASRGSAIGSSSGVTIHAENPATPSKGMIAYITKDYNSGWMPGDIRGAWLADTVAETVTGAELVTNGTFATDTTGWTISATKNHGTVTWDALGIKLTSDGSGSGEIAGNQTLTTVVGKTYVLSIERATGTVAAGGAVVTVGTTVDGNQYGSIGGTATTGRFSLTFVATGTAVYIGAVAASATPGQYGIFDNISCRLADVDRSVKAKGLQAFGSLTKAAVASGAALMGYSGFSAANHLEQPYNSDLDFGTGDFCIMGWAKFAATAAKEVIFCRDSPTTGKLIRLQVDVTTSYLSASAYDGTTTRTATGAAAIDDATWKHVLLTYSAGTLTIYVNGVSYATATGAALLTLNNATAVCDIGVDSQHANPATNGTLALWRAGATVPSAEQIKHIYETERPMFEANAQCCLAGTSNAVTALAYDEDTDLLHVGTSYGRSAFKGLVRVSSEATPVGAITALAASAGVVVQGGASGVDVYVPAYTLREELLRDAEQMARFGQNLIAHDFTATASQTTFTLPVGWEIVAVYQQGSIKRETTSWTRSFDGFKWSAVLGTGATVSDWISILAKRV